MEQPRNFADLQLQELSNAYKTLREYESILSILPDIIYKIDPEGNFVYVSNTVSMLGFEPEELLGKHFSALVHPEDVPKVSRKEVLPRLMGKTTGEEKAPKLFDETRTGRRITKKLGVRLISKFTSPKEVTRGLVAMEGEVTASGIYNRLVHEQAKEFEGTSGRIILKSQAGKNADPLIMPHPFRAEKEKERTRDKSLEGTIGVIRDVSELRNLEEKKRQLEHQLYHSRKMQTIGELAGGIAHDFNNLLSIMLGQTEIILRQYADLNQPLSNSVIAIQKTIIQAADLNSKLLTFARKVKIADIPINLHEVISETYHLLTHSFDKSFQLREELEAGDSMVIGDANLLKNALINIALNARDAMPQGGTLVFKTTGIQGASLKSRFPDQPITAEEYIALAVQDSGVGMDPEVLERLFEPFFTTKGQGKGTGLGLSCVEGIVEMHNGLIDVESTKGVGSTFIIYLPLVREEMSIQSSEAEDAPLPEEILGHILIVDDEPIVLETQTLLLRELGYRVTPFPDSIDAINYFREHHPTVDLIVLDYNMPYLNGKQCFLELKSISPEIKTIISTGCNIDNEAEDLFKAGIKGIIQKPFPIRKLLQTINNVLGKTPSVI
jgi:PAS domain S-box-containing protein